MKFSFLELNKKCVPLVDSLHHWNVGWSLVSTPHHFHSCYNDSTYEAVFLSAVVHFLREERYQNIVNQVDIDAV